MKGNTFDGDVPSILSKEYLATFIEELNEKQTVSIKEISDLAHAWGNDYVSSLEAYLFLKKNNATLDKEITLDDIQTYIRFELNYGRNRPGENIMRMFAFLFPGSGQGKQSTKSFV